MFKVAGCRVAMDIDYIKMVFGNHYRLLKARRALSIFKDVPLRTRRALSLYKVYGDMASFWFSTEQL